MSLILVRVDDRLIHGQVIEGWLRVVQAQRIVVASDAAATDSFQIDLMRLAVPDHVALDVWTVKRALGWLKNDLPADERVMLLVPGVAELAELVDGGAPIREVNLGGVHHGPARRMLTPHLSLSKEERTTLTRLEKQKIAIETRALPTDEARDLKSLLADGHA